MRIINELQISRSHEAFVWYIRDIVANYDIRWNIVCQAAICAADVIPSTVVSEPTVKLVCVLSRQAVFRLAYTFDCNTCAFVILEDKENLLLYYLFIY